MTFKNWWGPIFLIGVAMALAVLLVAPKLHAEEPNLDWKAAGVGMGLLISPLAVTDPYLSWGHAIELEGWSYAATDIFGRFLPKDFWYIAPLMVLAVDSTYRAGEGFEKKGTGEKYACDLLGIAGRVTVEIDF